MHKATPVINKWDQHHLLLSSARKIAIRKKIESLCEWSQATFYKKKKDPDSLKQWEKKIVATAYGVPIKFFFGTIIKQQTAA